MLSFLLPRGALGKGHHWNVAVAFLEKMLDKLLGRETQVTWRKEKCPKCPFNAFRPFRLKVRLKFECLWLRLVLPNSVPRLRGANYANAVPMLSRTDITVDDISIPYTVSVYLWALIHPSWSNADLFPRTENAFMTLMSKKQSSRHPEITYWGIEMWKGNLVYNVPLRHITRSATELLATLVKVESNGSGQVGCSWVASGWNLDRQCFLGALRFTLRVLKFPRTHFGRSFGHERSSELSERAWRQRQFLGVDFGLWKEVSGSKYVCSLAIGSNVWIAWTEASCDFWVLMSIFIINPCDSESFPGAGWWRAWTGASWNAQ